MGWFVGGAGGYLGKLSLLANEWHRVQQSSIPTNNMPKMVIYYYNKRLQVIQSHKRLIQTVQIP